MGAVMARPIRIQYPGALYHVMARGNRRQPVFGDDQDRNLFLNALGEAFVDKLERYLGAAMRGRRRESHSGQAKTAHDEAAAAAALAAALKVLGLERAGLAQRPKGSPEKAVLAWWLRQRTTVGLRWLSDRLGMGHLTRVSQAISQVRHRPTIAQQRIKRRLAKAARA
jgi:hypothetical protein